MSKAYYIRVGPKDISPNMRIVLFGSGSISGNMSGFSSNPTLFKAKKDFESMIKPQSAIRC